MESKPEEASLRPTGKTSEKGRGIAVTLAQLAADSFGLYLAFSTVVFKITKIHKVTDGALTETPHPSFLGNLALLKGKKNTLLDPRKSYILKTFIQSVIIGFEAKMSQLMTEAKTDPTKLKSNPDGVSPLQEIQSKVQKSILEKGAETGYFFVEAFKKSLAEQIKKIKDAAKYQSGLLTGDDFVFAPTENPGAIGKRFRAFRSEKHSLFFVPYLYDVFDYTPAVFSAACSTLFIGLDRAGRLIGDEMAELTVKLFNSVPIKYAHPDPQILVSASKATVALLFLYMEATTIAEEAVDLWKGMWYDSLFCPLFSGVMVGLYIEAAKDYPEVFTQFKKEIDEFKEAANIEERSFKESVVDAYEQAKKIIFDSYAQGRNDYEKYDESYLGELKVSGLRRENFVGTDAEFEEATKKPEDLEKKASESDDAFDERKKEFKEGKKKYSDEGLERKNYDSDDAFEKAKKALNDQILRKYFKGTDAELEKAKQEYRDQRMYRAFVKNVPASKKYMEARGVVLSIFDTSLLKGRKWIKTTCLTLRASLLIAQLISSKLLFSASKYVAQVAYKALPILKKHITERYVPGKDRAAASPGPSTESVMTAIGSRESLMADVNKTKTEEVKVATQDKHLMTDSTT